MVMRTLATLGMWSSIMGRNSSSTSCPLGEFNVCVCMYVCMYVCMCVCVCVCVCCESLFMSNIEKFVNISKILKCVVGYFFSWY
jgi:hypothetical protein